MMKRGMLLMIGVVTSDASCHPTAPPPSKFAAWNCRPDRRPNVPGDVRAPKGDSSYEDCQDVCRKDMQCVGMMFRHNQCHLFKAFFDLQEFVQSTTFENGTRACSFRYEFCEPPTSGNWDCYTNKVPSGVGFHHMVTNLGRWLPTTLYGCKDYCFNSRNCGGVYWDDDHKHCHVYLGGFYHDAFVASLTSSETNGTGCAAQGSSKLTEPLLV